MQALPPIPVPVSTRWREIRTRVLPGCLAFASLVAAAWLWRYETSVGSFAGVAEGVRATVSSPQPGSIRELLVRPFQVVQAGDPLATLVPTDVRTGLALLQSELQLARLAAEPTIPEQNALDFERLQFELMRTQSELAIAEVNLQRAENQVRRQTPLFEQKLVSEDLYDLTSKDRDSLLAEVRIKSNTVVKMSRRLEDLRSLGEPQPRALNNSTGTLLSSLVSHQRAMVSNIGPIVLTAPISGMISAVQRRAGEQVLEGEALIMISSPRAERVVGFLRQPYPIQPTVGMEALLRTRDSRRLQFVGVISQVGAQMEYITNSLAILRPGAMVDTGLPVVIDLPPQAKIRPGEVVDISIRELPSARVSVPEEFALVQAKDFERR